MKKIEQSQIVIYKTENGETKIDVRFDGENVWLTQKLMAELFNVGIPAINKHLKNIFKEGELLEDSVISKMETTAKDSKKYKVIYYNLDAIIGVGYRVNSKNATNFRIWATDKLKQYIVKGFVVDSDRLKNPNEPKDVVKNWMRNYSTIEFLGVWERINNPNFKGVEFDSFKKEAGANSFTLSLQSMIISVFLMLWNSITLKIV